MRMIFVNLPVQSVERSKAFFNALGFGFNPDYSDAQTLCMIVEENIFVMLLEHARFSDFVTGPISDASESTEVLTCLSADSREQVDDLLAKALANGGKAWKPTFEMGPMYGASFQDPDGHVWELMHMQMG